MTYLPTAQAVSVFFCAVLLSMMAVTPAHAVFINEIHYDNAGADTDEGVELSGAVGVDLTGWSLVLYNGGNYRPTAQISPSMVFLRRAKMVWGCWILASPVYKTGLRMALPW